MTSGFWAAYTIKLGVLALALSGLYALMLRVRGRRHGARGAERRISVVESAMLSQHAAVHLLRIGERYVLVGAGDTHVCKLTEFERGELEGACGDSVRPRST